MKANVLQKKLKQFKDTKYPELKKDMGIVVAYTKSKLPPTKDKTKKK